MLSPDFERPGRRIPTAAPERALHEQGDVKRGSIFATGVVQLLACAVVSAAIGDRPEEGAARPDARSAQTARAPRTTKAPPRSPRFHEYQVPAGTTLPVELRTRLTSNGNRRSDEIEGRLLRPLTTSDGVELVPAGASVLGTVSDATPAGRQPGRLVFTFRIIQHPETGSRATITATELTFESQPPAKGKIFNDVQLEKGTDASILLVAPLLVRIPVSN